MSYKKEITKSVKQKVIRECSSARLVYARIKNTINANISRVITVWGMEK